MAISIQTNTASLLTSRILDRSQSGLAQSVEKLSSGQRINSAADDTAGLVQSERFKAHVASISKAIRNANDGISLIQVADSGFAEMSEIVSRMRELAMQSSNGVLTNTERSSLNNEMLQGKSELQRIVDSTEFNGLKLIGVSRNSISLQVGANNTSNDRLSVNIGLKLSTVNLINTISDISSQSNAQNTLASIDSLLSELTEYRNEYGNSQNRLESSLSNLRTSAETLSAANSRIRDTDIAVETANLTKNQILSQAGAAMLTQASSAPSVALSLLG
jgi:flagellin